MGLLNALQMLGSGIFGTSPQLNPNPQTDELGNNLDEHGNVISDDEAASKTWTPARTPSFWENVLDPNVASQEGQINNQRQLMANRALDENNATLGVGRSNYGLLTPEEQTAMVSPSRYALAYGANGATPSSVLGQGTALGDIKAGIIPPTVATDIQTAKNNLYAAKNVVPLQNQLHNTLLGGSINRAPITEAGLDQDAVNNLAQSLKVTPQQIALTAAKLKAEYGREPDVETLTNTILSNQQTEANQATKLLPVTGAIRQTQAEGMANRLPMSEGLASTSLGNELTKAAQEHGTLPFTGNTALNQAKLGSAMSDQQIKDLSNTIDAMHKQSVLGSYTAGIENPSGVLSPMVYGDSVKLGRTFAPTEMQTRMVGLDETNGNTGSKTVTIPSGYTGTANSMYTAPSGLKDNYSPSAQIQERNSQPVGTAPPASGAGKPPPTAGGTSAKTDDYASLIKEASQARHDYGNFSPQHAQALAKIHAKENEEMPSALDETGQAATIPTALKSMASDTTDVARKTLAGGIEGQNWLLKQIFSRYLQPNQ